MNTKNNLKLLICLDGFKQGGTQHAILLLLPYFCKNFRKVFLVILQMDSDDLKIPKLTNLEVKKFNSKKFLDLKLIWQLKLLIWKYKPNIILSSMFRSIILTAMLKNFGAKVLWMEQNTYINRSKFQWKLFKVLSTRIYKAICISEDVAEISTKHLAKVVESAVIPNPIAKTDFKTFCTQRNNEFIFIGRLVPQKNPLLALHAFKEFTNRFNSDSKLHFVGDGDLSPNLVKESRKLGISEQCVFHGFQPNEKVYSLLETSKTLISSSIIEGLAMVRLEALASGNCIVTTNSGGTNQFFHPSMDIGVLIAESNAINFAEKMYQSLDEKYWTHDLIQRRVNLASNYSPEKISIKFLQEFS